METTPLASHFAALACDLFGRGIPWWRAYRRPGIRRRVARLNQARAMLDQSRQFAPWNPVLTAWAGDILDGRFVDPLIRCTACGALVYARVISTDPTTVARETVLAGRHHRIVCGSTPTPDGKDTDVDDDRAPQP